MRGAGVGAMIVAAGPDLVEKKGAGLIGGGVKIVPETPGLFAGGANESAEFGLEEHVLPLFGAEGGDQGDGALGELDDFCGAGVTAGGAFF